MTYFNILIFVHCLGVDRWDATYLLILSHQFEGPFLASLFCKLCWLHIAQMLSQTAERCRKLKICCRKESTGSRTPFGTKLHHRSTISTGLSRQFTLKFYKHIFISVTCCLWHCEKLSHMWNMISCDVCCSSFDIIMVIALNAGPFSQYAMDAAHTIKKHIAWSNM